MSTSNTFAKIMIILFILMLFCTAVLLVPLGIFLTTLPCLSLEFLGGFLCLFGLFSAVNFLRIGKKLLLG